MHSLKQDQAGLPDPWGVRILQVADILGTLDVHDISARAQLLKGKQVVTHPESCLLMRSSGRW